MASACNEAGGRRDNQGKLMHEGTQTIVLTPTITATQPGLSNRVSAVAVGILVLVAAYFILPGARHVAIFGDEMRTWRDAITKDYSTILTWQHNADHAPLSYLLVKITCDLTGRDQGALMRLPSVIFGLLCIPAAFWLGRCVWSNALGVLVAAFAAVDVSLIWQSQQARMYPHLMLIMLVGLVQIVKLADGGAFSRWRWGLLGLTIGIGLWTHIASIVLGVGVLVLIGILIWQKYQAGFSQLKPILVGGILTISIVAMLGWPACFRLAEKAEEDEVESVNFPSTISQFNFTAKELSGSAILTGVMASLMVAGLIGLATKEPQRRAVASILLVVGLLTGINLFITSFWRPVLGARYLTSAYPSMWLGIGCILLWCFSNPYIFVRGIAGIVLAAHLSFQAYRCTDLINIFGTHQYANEFAKAVKLILRAQAKDESVQIIAVPSLPRLHRMYYKYKVARGMDVDIRGIVKASSKRLPVLLENRQKKWGKHDTYVLVVAPTSPTLRNTPADPRKFLPAVGKVFQVPVNVAKLATKKPTRVYVVKVTSKGSWVFDADGKELAASARTGPRARPTTAATQPGST